MNRWTCSSPITPKDKETQSVTVVNKLRTIEHLPCVINKPSPVRVPACHDSSEPGWTKQKKFSRSSEYVTLDGLGTFRMKMRSAGKGVATPDDVSAAQATLTASFRPSSTKNPDRTVATRSMVTGVKCVRFDRADASDADGDNAVDPTI